MRAFPRTCGFLRLGLVVLGGMVLGLVGCGKSTGDVSGKVTHNQRPLFAGEVVFQGSDNNYYRGNIGADGTYTVRQVPTGVAKVAVVVSQPGEVPGTDIMNKMKMDPAKMGNPEATKGDAGPAPLKLKLPKLPYKYADPKDSGLTFDVKAGENTFDIPLQ
jgi:hypothetical protein